MVRVSTIADLIKYARAGATIELDEGIYYLDCVNNAPALVINSNCRITGTGDVDKTIIRMRKMGWTKEGAAISSVCANNLYFENITFDAGYPVTGGKHGISLNTLYGFSRCNNIEFKNVKAINGLNDFFRMRNCSNLKVSGCDMRYSGHEIFYMLGGGHDLEFFNNVFHSRVHTAIRLSYDSYNCVIRDNYFNGSEGVSVGAPATGPAIQIDTKGNGTRNIRIYNNTFERFRMAAIFLYGDGRSSNSYGNKIYNNTIRYAAREDTSFNYGWAAIVCHQINCDIYSNKFFLPAKWARNGILDTTQPINPAYKGPTTDLRPADVYTVNLFDNLVDTGGVKKPLFTNPHNHIRVVTAGNSVGNEIIDDTTTTPPVPIPDQDPVNNTLVYSTDKIASTSIAALKTRYKLDNLALVVVEATQNNVTKRFITPIPPELAVGLPEFTVGPIRLRTKYRTLNGAMFQSIVDGVTEFKD